ncbi:Peptidase_C1 domain containing protein [uncultured Caudovirales phage]|uniref:Peptidase_C1 domain containing protein n=1 Tax=uncultured Caudovirales phage TaxID=2100421 RepID=A0A6J5LEX4_9CAUD|nr:Peptidase_C1 domain containing protein [uncultured Caudovirales phage]
MQWRNAIKRPTSEWYFNQYKLSNTPLREVVDLRPWASTIEDQRHLGSCTGNAIVGAYEMLLKRDAPTQYTELSRLFVYYNARLFDNAVDVDVGAFLYDGVRALQRWGICSEDLCPYIIQNFAVQPSLPSYVDAATRKIKNYYRLQTLNQILDALNHNYPIPFGANVYPAFENITSTNPMLPTPLYSEEPLGAHAMCMVGYNIPRRLILVRNSFGRDWGEEGHCWMPFEYVLNESLDCWVFDIELNPLVKVE